jgi:hypothetical protein
MRLIHQAVAVALIIAPAIAPAQEGAKLGQKQKAWMVSNFRAGLHCSSVHAGALSFSGKATFDAGVDGGVEVSASPSGEGPATVTALAINTKGTGAHKYSPARTACSAVAPTNGAAACSISGDASSPTVSATIPLSVFAAPAGSRYVGTVTIVKRTIPPGESHDAPASKRGYDDDKARSDMASAGAATNPQLTMLATCDSSALSSKGSKPSLATYDLAVAKK